MTKTALTILAVTSALVLGGIVPANAATFTETYDFTASDFIPSGSPVDPWTGSFTITFDPTLASSAALNSFSSNLPASYGTFSYLYTGTGGVLLIGNNCTSFCAVNPGTDSAFLDMFPVTASGGLSFNFANIASTSTVGIFNTEIGTLTPATPPTTPLPATLPLFASGLGGLGLLGWRRKRKARMSLLGAA